MVGPFLQMDFAEGLLWSIMGNIFLVPSLCAICSLRALTTSRSSSMVASPTVSFTTSHKWDTVSTGGGGVLVCDPPPPEF